MPMIDAKMTLSLSDQQKEELKSEFGKLIETLNKPESYLMVGIEDSADLWFGGKKLEKGAYIALFLFVGIPLPGTGAWTGTLAASILDMDFKKSTIAVMCGVVLAGIIIGILTMLGINILK